MIISDLLDIEASGCRLVAGAMGVHRDLLWAHSCELPDPYRWLGHNELLMTIGHCVPGEAPEQVDFIRHLERAGLCGLVVEDNDQAPQLHPEALEVANLLGFPVMLMKPQVPFASIARMVAAANNSNQAQQLMTLNQLYRAALGEYEHPSGFAQQLEDVFRVAMSAVDISTGVSVLPGSLTVHSSEIKKLSSEVLPYGQGMINRMSSLRDGELSVWSLPTQRPTVLLVEESAGSMLDSFTMTHLSQVIAGEVNRRTHTALGLAHQRSHLFADSLENSTSQDRLVRDATQLGQPVQDLLIAITAIDNEELVFSSLSLAGIAHASQIQNGYYASIVRSTDLPVLASISEFHGIGIGISPAVADLSEVKDGLLRAQVAYESGDGVESGILPYDEVNFSLAPKSASQAKEIVDRVLGPLSQAGTSEQALIDTLCAYLDANRNWNEASAKLGIHRQTLSYRIGRIEQLTGRNLKSSKDLAELWIARIALKRS
ncbi:PucR family transcriptional regulator [Glutamicibacter sp. JC586]|uniref:PucR family transcriptional regulator n=1 Tax=Glutamicibacter sp. JC586 TaxID=2590552 RepID=UPI001357B54B|nr:PucR family transcriptional regulator [Glutamicibacter sp. JC586]